MAKPDSRTMGDYRRRVDDEEVNYGFQLATSCNFEIKIFSFQDEEIFPLMALLQLMHTNIYKNSKVYAHSTI